MIRVLSPSNIAVPWRPWHNLAIDDVYVRNPDDVFAVAGLARLHPDECPPLLRRAIQIYVMRRQLELVGPAARRRRPHATATVA